MLDDDDEEEGFDQSRYDEISDFTSTSPYKVGMDPHSWPYDLDFPFPENDGDPDASAWCVWKGMPDPNELSGVIWEPLTPFGLTRAEVDAEVARLPEDLEVRGRLEAPPRQSPAHRSTASVGAPTAMVINQQLSTIAVE